MTNEEFERKAEFLLNQQAKFEVGMQKLQEAQSELWEAQAVTEKKVKEVAETAAHAAEAALSAAEGVAETGKVVTQLTTITREGFRLVFENSKNQDAKISALVDSQMLTEERLRDLAATVDRHIREGHHRAEA